MNSEAVVTTLMAIGAVVSVIGLATGRAVRVCAGASVLLVGVALLVGWTSDPSYHVNKTVAVVATLGIILAAAYVLWMVQRTTQGAQNPALAEVPAMRRDISLREGLVVTPLIALLLVFGFYPKPLLDVINPAVAATMQDVGKSDPAPEAQEASR